MQYINITQIQNFTPQQFVVHCSNMTAMPALIIYFVASMLVFLGLGLGVAKNKTSFVTKIWIPTFIFNLVIAAGIIFCPNAIQITLDFFRRLFTF
jgi:hypothetical protein